MYATWTLQIGADMFALSGASFVRAVADLIAERARPGADLPGASLGSADLIAVSSRAGEAGGWSLERDPDPFGDRADFRGRRVDAARALSGSGFSLRLGEGGGGRFAAWGAGAAAEVEIEVDGYETEYDGDVYAAQIGVEMDVAAGVAVGVAVGTAQGELEVRNSGLRRIERGLLSVHPYMVWTSGAHSGWLAVGFGSGDYEVERADGARASADASTTMWGGGVETRGEAGGFALSARASAVGSRSDLDEALALPGKLIDGGSEFWRLRAEFEAGRSFEGARGAVFRPYVAAGGRQDGGDGPTGGAGELGVGLRFGLDRSLEADLSARVQVTDAELEENTLSGSLRYDDGGDERGLLLNAGSQRRYVEEDDGTDLSAVHRGRIGYGWAGSMLERTGRAELYVGGSRGDGRRGPQVGAQFDAAPLSLGISGGGGEMRLEMDYRF